MEEPNPDRRLGLPVGPGGGVGGIVDRRRIRRSRSVTLDEDVGHLFEVRPHHLGLGV